ncbi:hypothetical protein M514_06487 [Trichuris suis]|uniref:Phosphatidylinositol 4-kinase beta n=1 Tax=Trichuris suis TaxID=68888 RepID=A0A085N307_9BILA|nr:hypothetical protein M514_06487 [Trichuris suis]
MEDTYRSVCPHGRLRDSVMCVKCTLEQAFDLTDKSPVLQQNNEVHGTNSAVSSENDGAHNENNSTVLCTGEIPATMQQAHNKRLHTPVNPAVLPVTPSSGTRQSLLLRLFESKVFDMRIAIQYLFSSKEAGVLTYLGNRMFSFAEEDVDFYLPQLVSLYINEREIAEVLHPYFLHRCRKSVEFSLKTAWLLDAFGVESLRGCKRRTHGLKLKNLILSEQIRPKCQASEKVWRSNLTVISAVTVSDKKGHYRSRSDATADHSRVLKRENSVSSLRSLYSHSGDLSTGRAFDNGCCCHKASEEAVAVLSESVRDCICNAPRLMPEAEFVKCLTAIGYRLRTICNREDRTSRLAAELAMLNLNLPARVWLPIYSEFPHHIVRIPPNAGVVLNSKDKVYRRIGNSVEVSEKSSPFPLAQKSLEDRSGHSRSADSLNRSSSCSFAESPSYLTFWTQSGVEDPELENIRRQFPFDKIVTSDSLSQVSVESTTSADSKDLGVVITANEVRRRLTESLCAPNKQLKHSNEDPSASVLSEPWIEKAKRIRENSPYGNLPGWRLLPVMVKTGDDLRQELLAYQIMCQLQEIWNLERVPLRLRLYKTLVISRDAGMIEPVVNAVSLHQIKRSLTADGKKNCTVLDHFLSEFGEFNSEEFLTAQNNFIRSCAAYSLMCYLLQVKDSISGAVTSDKSSFPSSSSMLFVKSSMWTTTFVPSNPSPQTLFDKSMISFMTSLIGSAPSATTSWHTTRTDFFQEEMIVSGSALSMAVASVIEQSFHRAISCQFVKKFRAGERRSAPGENLFEWPPYGTLAIARTDLLRENVLSSNCLCIRTCFDGEDDEKRSLNIAMRISWGADLKAKIRDEVLQALTAEKEMVTFLWLSAKFNIHVNAAKRSFRILDELYKEYKDEKNLHAVFYLSGYQKVGENQEHMEMLDVVLSCHTYCVHTAEIKDLIASYITDQSVSLPPSHRAILPLASEPDKEINSSASPRSKKLLGKQPSSDQLITTPLKNVNSAKSRDQRNLVPLGLEHYSVPNDGTDASVSKANSEYPLSNDLFTDESSTESRPQKRSDDREKKSSNKKKSRAERKGKEVNTSKVKSDHQSSPERTTCGSSPNVNVVRLDKQATLNETHEIRRRKTSFKTFVDDDDYLVTKRINETETVPGNYSTAADLQHGTSMEEDNDTSEPASSKGKSSAPSKKKQNPLTNFFKKA